MKILRYVCSVILVVVAAVTSLVMISWGVGLMDTIQATTLLQYGLFTGPAQQWQAAIFGAVVLLALIGLILSLRGESDGGSVSFPINDGTVVIPFHTINEYLERSAANMPYVHDLQARVAVNQNEEVTGDVRLVVEATQDEI